MTNPLFVCREIFPLRMKNSVRFHSRSAAYDNFALAFILREPVGRATRDVEDIVMIELEILVVYGGEHSAFPAKKQCFLRCMNENSTPGRPIEFIHTIGKELQI